MKQGYGLTCGHCGHVLRIRTSEGLAHTFRVLFLQCTNELCGATYRGNVEITHQYSPSGQPNTQFNLPTPATVLRHQDKQTLALLEGESQLDLLDASNDAMAPHHAPQTEDDPHE